MKIAFLTPEFPHPETGTSGGIGTSIKNLATRLAQDGVPVSILVYGQTSDSVFEENGMTVYRIKNIKIKGLSWYLTRKKIQHLINKLHLEQKVDVVEAPDWTGITSFIKTKCPIVIRLHGSDTYFCHLDQRPVKWINRFHEKRALQKADALLSVSRYTAGLTNELFALNREFTVIPNGIDTEKFAAPENHTSQNSILYFGTLIRKKGLLELPHIFNAVYQKYPDARLILVGKDSPDIISGNASTWKMMQPLFAETAFRNVNYPGSVDYSEIKSMIQDAAVCVFPTFAEALPVSWIEAMAMGKPLVASEIGWATEVIENGKSGLLEHPKKHREYADKIVRLLQDEALRNAVGHEARKRVLEKFDIKVVANQNIGFYSGLLKKK